MLSFKSENTINCLKYSVSLDSTETLVNLLRNVTFHIHVNVKCGRKLLSINPCHFYSFDKNCKWNLSCGVISFFGEITHIISKLLNG